MNETGTAYDISLIDGFLNPLEFSRSAGGETLSAAQAAGADLPGRSHDSPGTQIDEFVTEAVRNNLLGLPLDLRCAQPGARPERGRRAVERGAPAGSNLAVR